MQKCFIICMLALIFRLSPAAERPAAQRVPQAQALQADRPARQYTCMRYDPQKLLC